VVADPIPDCIITDHATVELTRRRLSTEVIDSVLRNPEQRFEVRPHRVILQSRVQESGSEYLVRVFVDIDRAPAEVVTAYRTSKVSKYWRDDV
jgi:hypothetical protein